MIERDIVRQVDGGDEAIAKLTDTAHVMQIIWVIVGGLSFTYFLILTGGKDEPYLWSFLETMQLLTHI